MQLLVVGNITGLLSGACHIAIKQGAKILTVDNIDAALDSLRSGQRIDMVMVDVEMNIAGLIQAMNSARIDTVVIACGTSNNPVLAAQAIKSGAKEYLPLPPDAELIAAIFQAIRDDQHKLLVFDSAMQKAVAMAERVAKSNAAILITGSSGTGKEVIARHIHRHSPRNGNAFVAVNCAAIPETLLESELFGYERGAFTGATARRIGRFEEANNGTLLLDEITEMDPRLQAKLLRVIQEQVIDRLGGRAPVPVKVRILATSNRDMQQAVAAGQFREDLYYRLNVISLNLPDLTARPKDIIGLARNFVKTFCQENDLALMELSKEAENKLLGYNWPGNVRELENVMHRSVLMHSGTVLDADSIMLATAGNANPQSAHDSEDALRANIIATSAGRTVADVERELIINTLDNCFGNRTRAAKILGISVRTLRNKLHKYDLKETVSPLPGSN